QRELRFAYQDPQTRSSEQVMGNIYIGLVHYPVLNKFTETVITSVSNLDIHDIARSAHTYGVRKYFLITPETNQQELIKRITGFWSKNPAIMYNPMRSEALEVTHVCSSIEESINLITTQEKKRPILITTTARKMPKQVSFGYLRTLSTTASPAYILFGTGYGLIDDVHNSADYILEPIYGRGEYNHLSVRSAVAIVLDRILSEDIHGRNNGYSANS
ncbi:MAG: RNA methyltransferase, partial [Candidatus Cloacimonadaceae bacterium]|nr:RNA methyltransferase [Candidatus Cloacimonadaceae bacterium]